MPSDRPSRPEGPAEAMAQAAHISTLEAPGEPDESVRGAITACYETARGRSQSPPVEEGGARSQDALIEVERP